MVREASAAISSPQGRTISPRGVRAAPRAASIVWSVAALVALALVTPGLARAQTVDSVVASHRGGCTTAGVEGLSRQLVRTHLCMFPRRSRRSRRTPASR
jgi:hypothetical protein